MSSPSELDLEEWASWFRCLADPTRLKIIHHLASLDHAVTVGEIVEAVGRSQSTVSKHLKILGEQKFVLAEPDGIRTMIRANPLCMTALPEAAAAIMDSNPS